MSQKTIPLWVQPGGAPFAVGANAHQFFSRNDNGFLTESAQNTTLKDAGQGIWFKINCSGYKYLSIAGELVMHNANGYTTGAPDLRAIAFFRGPDFRHPSAIEEVLGKDLLGSAANDVVGNSRLMCAGMTDSTNGVTTMIVSRDFAAPQIVVTTVSDPIMKATGAATGDVRRWMFEVGQGHFDISPNTALAGFTKTLPSADKLLSIIGVTTAYLAIKSVNAIGGITGGAGTPEIGGQISAILSNDQQSS